jgi:uncharacterized membrane protein
LPQSSSLGTPQVRSGFVKPVFWTVLGLMMILALLFTSLPMLRTTHPLHYLLYSQRWLLFPHIAAGLTAMILGPLQFSARLRRRNIARHRILGKIYVGAVVVATLLATTIAWHYPAFFPYSAATQSGAWLVTTGAAFFTARNRHIEQHRRWMARSYAIGCVFILARILNFVPAYTRISLEAGSYAILLLTIVAMMAADLIVDWPLIVSRKFVSR